MALQAGERAYVRYGGEPDLFHARLLVGLVEGTEWTVVTPTMDVFAEDVGEENPDLEEVVRVGRGSRLPVSLHGADVYNFEPPLRGPQVRVLMAEGARLAAEERARRGLVGRAQDLAPVETEAPAPALPVAPLRAAGAPAPEGRLALAEEELEDFVEAVEEETAGIVGGACEAIPLLSSRPLGERRPDGVGVRRKMCLAPGSRMAPRWTWGDAATGIASCIVWDGEAWRA